MRTSILVCLTFLASFTAHGDLPYLDGFAIGGTDMDVVAALRVDSNGDVVVGGDFFGAVDFDPGPGENIVTASGRDQFVARYTADGALLWVNHIAGPGVGGSGFSVGGLDLDEQGAVYVAAGIAGQADLDPGPGVQAVDATGFWLGKFAANGDLDWAFTIDTGDSFGPDSGALDLDYRAGSVTLVATYRFDTDVDPGPGTTTISLNANLRPDPFVVRYDAADGAFEWVIPLPQISTNGNGTSDNVRGVHALADGGIVITGAMKGQRDFDPGPGETLLQSAGAEPFLARYDADGDLVWAKKLTSDGLRNEGLALGSDAQGNLYLTGDFFGTLDMDPEPMQLAEIDSAGFADIFLAKYSGSGLFQWGNRIGGDAFDYPYDLHVTADGIATVAGWLRDVVTANGGCRSETVRASFDDNAFIARYDTAGRLLAQAIAFPNDNSVARAIDVAPGGQIVVGGHFEGIVDFDPGPGDGSFDAGNRSDGFVVTYGSSSKAAQSTYDALHQDGFECGS